MLRISMVFSLKMAGHLSLVEARLEGLLEPAPEACTLVALAEAGYMQAGIEAGQSVRRVVGEKAGLPEHPAAF